MSQSSLIHMANTKYRIQNTKWCPGINCLPVWNVPLLLFCCLAGLYTPYMEGGRFWLWRQRHMSLWSSFWWRRHLSLSLTLRWKRPLCLWLTLWWKRSLRFWLKKIQVLWWHLLCLQLLCSLSYSLPSLNSSIHQCPQRSCEWFCILIRTCGLDIQSLAVGPKQNMKWWIIKISPQLRWLEIGQIKSGHMHNMHIHRWCRILLSEMWTTV